jgi:hypothetical protein
MTPLLVWLALALPAGAVEMSGGDFSLTGGMAGSGVELSAGGVTGQLAGAAASDCGAEGNRTGGTYTGLCGNSAYSLLSAAVSNTVNSAGNTVSVTVPQNSAPEDFDLFINTDPQATPQRVDSEVIRQATAKLRNALGPSFIPAPQGVVELNMIQEDEQFYDGALSPLASLSLKYTDANGDGIVDGSNPPIRAHTLRLWRLDPGQRLWVRVPDSSVDTANKALTAAIPHFSVYAMIGAADADVGAVYAYPVPWSPNNGSANCANGITFTNLPSEGAIRIYNLAGELVRSQDITSAAGSMCWDVKTNGGRSVSSGVYLWVVQAGSNRKIGKLMIIR